MNKPKRTKEPEVNNKDTVDFDQLMTVLLSVPSKENKEVKEKARKERKKKETK